MRTHNCGVINEDLVDNEVTLCGWVHRRRDHGGVIFIDLRDIRELAKTGRVAGARHVPRGMLEFWIDPATSYH